MKFQLRTILSSTALLLSAAKADDVKLFTSDGVVYSYAVVTSTIAPPSVRVETHYYTTTRVREFTLADSEVRTTTENIVSASETTSPVESTYSSSTPASTSSSSTQVTDSRSTSTLEPASVNSLTGSTSSSTPSSSTSGSSQLLSSTTAVTSSFSPTISPMSSTDRSSSSPTTVVGSDGKCSVYYDDDEYYSTVYLTEPNQSVDAATTITSTRLVYETLTLI